MRWTSHVQDDERSGLATDNQSYRKSRGLVAPARGDEGRIGNDPNTHILYRFHGISASTGRRSVHKGGRRQPANRSWDLPSTGAHQDGSCSHKESYASTPTDRVQAEHGQGWRKGR